MCVCMCVCVYVWCGCVCNAHMKKLMNKSHIRSPNNMEVRTT